MGAVRGRRGRRGGRGRRTASWPTPTTTRRRPPWTKSTRAPTSTPPAPVWAASELAEARRGSIDVASAQELLQDRTCYPDTLCREPADSPERDVTTFASLVAVPATGERWVAVGPPSQHPYQRHTFGA